MSFHTISYVAVNVSVVNISVALGSKPISCIVVQVDGTLVVIVVAVVSSCSNI
jgi:hypothetical protein